MSGIVQIFLIAISLAMDAFSVSIAGGMKSQKAKVIHAVKVAAFFGIFQAVMPLLGWLIGEAAKGFILSIDHWVAFILLGFIGVNMIREARKDDGVERKDMLKTNILLMLAVATSIDAFIVGITLSLLQTPLLVSVTIIGIVTFVLSFVGFIFGKQLGALFGKKVEIAGGVVLILIGLNILIQHFIS